MTSDNKIDKRDVINFYDKYVERQRRVGVNLRHYTIINYLVSAGLGKTSQILEIGCGIGTLTGLIGKIARNGKVVATDISPVSINEAQSRLNHLKNVSCLVSDLSNLNNTSPFDFVVLADVLEHIPVEDYDQLFKRIAELTHKGSKIIIHIPHPDTIKYIRRTNPEQLQVIDQALTSAELTPFFNQHGFVIHKYLPHSLFHKEFDAVFIELHKEGTADFHPLSKVEIIIRKLVNRIHYQLNKF